MHKANERLSKFATVAEADAESFFMTYKYAYTSEQVFAYGAHFSDYNDKMWDLTEKVQNKMRELFPSR
jgi:hypothetical protein